MSLRTVQPRKPKTPRPAPGSRHASPATSPHKPAILSALTNMATMSGGTPPGGGSGGQETSAPWESDPVLQQIKGLQAANIATADAQALAARQKALINFGYSSELGNLYGDQGTQGAAQANPYSVLKELENSHNLRQKNLNEGLNRSNLWYSSTRGAKLGEESKQYLGEQYDAGQKLQGYLGELENAKLGAHQNADAANAQASQDAYSRWLNQQLQYGLGNAGGGIGKPKPIMRAKPLQRPRLRRP